MPDVLDPMTEDKTSAPMDTDNSSMETAMSDSSGKLQSGNSQPGNAQLGNAQSDHSRPDNFQSANSQSAGVSSQESPTDVAQKFSSTHGHNTRVVQNFSSTHGHNTRVIERLVRRLDRDNTEQVMAVSAKITKAMSRMSDWDPHKNAYPWKSCRWLRKQHLTIEMKRRNDKRTIYQFQLDPLQDPNVDSALVLFTKCGEYPFTQTFPDWRGPRLNLFEGESCDFNFTVKFSHEVKTTVHSMSGNDPAVVFVCGHDLYMDWRQLRDNILGEGTEVQ